MLYKVPLASHGTVWHYPTCPMATKETPAFSARLRRELDSRDWGVRTLAREIATRRQQPERVESLRRQLRKYLDGTQPSPANRRLIEEALGLERDALKDDDDEESEPLLQRIVIPVNVSIDYALLARAMEQRAQA